MGPLYVSLSPAWPQADHLVTAQDIVLYQAGQDSSIWSRRVFFVRKGRKIHPALHFPPEPPAATIRGIFVE